MNWTSPTFQHISTHQDFLEGLETSVQPDIDSGADDGRLTIEGVGNRQEVVWPNCEELPVVRSGRGQSLVHLKQLMGRVGGRMWMREG